MARKKKEEEPIITITEEVLMEEKPKNKTKKKNKLKVISKGLNVRAEAKIGATVITIMYEGDELELASKDLYDGFYAVKCSGRVGYVMQEFVKLV